MHTNRSGWTAYDVLLTENKNSGRPGDPCGTAQVIFDKSGWQLIMFTRSIRSDRYDLKAGNPFIRGTKCM